jgi:hypothetical protein
MKGEDSEERKPGREAEDGLMVVRRLVGQAKGTELEGLGSAKHLSSDHRPGNPTTGGGGEALSKEWNRRNRDRDRR